MKKILRTVAMVVILAFPLMMTAQEPPHPGGGNPPGGGDPPVGGGAPIDGGLSVMIILGAAYGGKKAFKAFK